MKKSLFLILLLTLFQSAFSQIKFSSGTDVPPTVSYCPGESFGLQVDDYSSAGTSGLTEESESVYNSLWASGVGESDVPFTALTRDNVFSNSINLGFPFSFYGKTYTKVAVGTNGRLVFNDSAVDGLNDSSVYKDRTFSDPAVPLPNKSYNMIYRAAPTDREVPLAQIFAGFTRLRSNTLTTFYKYKPVIYSGLRGMVFIFQEVIPHNGTGGDYGGRFTSRVLLLEDGRVIINVTGKVNATYNAILGTQNEDATKYMVPAYLGTAGYNYNNGYWISESLKAFVFKTGLTRTPTYSWKLNGSAVSSTRFYPNPGTFTPNDGDQVEVDITFAETGVAAMHDEVIFKKIKTPVIQKTVTGCSVILKIDPSTYDSALTYKWFRNGSPTEISSGEDLVLFKSSAADSYYVKVFKADGTSCADAVSKSNSITFGGLFPSAVKKGSVCYVDNTPAPAAQKTGINLYTEFYDKYAAASGFENYTVEFSDINGIISNPENYSIDANESTEVSVKARLSGASTDCYSAVVTLHFISAKNSETVSVCASSPTFDLKSYFETRFTAPGYSLQYTYSDGSAVMNANAVDVTKSYSVKISVSSLCSATTTVNFAVGTAITVPAVPIQERCAGDKSALSNWFDLEAVRKILDPADLYDVKFYRKSDHTELSVDTSDSSELSGTNFWSGRTGDYLIYAKLYNRSTPACFGQSADIILRVYQKPSLLKPLIEKFNCPGNHIYNLNQTSADLTDAGSHVSLTLEYYSQSGQLLTASQISAYDAALYGNQPYIMIVYNPSCSATVKFDLKSHPKPVSKISQITVCEEITYWADNFKNVVIDNATQYSFFEKDGVTPLRSSFGLSVLPIDVEFFIKNNTTGCLSDLQKVTFAKGTASVLLKSQTDYEICDITPDYFDGKTAFDLDSKKGDFTTVAGTVFKYYHDAARTQEITDPADYTNETAFNQKIYLKITLPGFCPSDAEMNLTVNTSTKSSTLSNKYFICFGESVAVDAGPENSQFSWSNGGAGQTKTFTQPGNYAVTLTNAQGCSYTHSFTVSDENQPEISKINQAENRIEVIAAGKYPIEYSFDGGLTWGSSNILMNPKSERYIIKVRSVLPNRSSCLGEEKFIYPINITNFITPNADGKNDNWFVENLDKMEETEIIISDRYGKTVFHSTDKNNLVWDGKLSGRVLPTATYWFVVKWYDPSTTKNEVRQGWILLKNRN